MSYQAWSLAALAASVATSAISGFRSERHAGLAGYVAGQVAPDAEAGDAMLDWLAPDRSQGTACLIDLFLLIVSVVLAVKAFGFGGLWLGILWLLLIMIGAAAGQIGGKRKGPVAGQLSRLSARACAAGERFAASGAVPQAELAKAVVTHIERLLRLQPSLTASQLEHYHTPRQIARYLLEDLLPEPEAIPEDPEETAVAYWLKRSDRALSEDPTEWSRCRLLNRIRDELVAGGGVHFADEQRVREMVEELRAWSPSS